MARGAGIARRGALMLLAGRPGEHLTYCTNVHGGDALADVLAAIDAHVPRIKALVAPDRAFGVGLRLSAAAAAELGDPARFAALAGRLAAHDAYVFTINGFPYGRFHGAGVKTGVYAPDWSDPARLAYTDRLADLLVRLLPEGVSGSISTVPLAFRADAAGLATITRHLIAHVAHLVSLARTTGQSVMLALEPEPGCVLETVADACDYIETRLFSAAAADELAALAGLSRADAARAIRAHVGLCYDVCHAAVEYEDAAVGIARLRAAGIAVAKLQLSSALRIPAMSVEAAAALRAFDEPAYLHQVVERRGTALVRYDDLPQALARLDAAIGAEWRVHFHVPVFLAELSAFSTTQGFLADVLALHRAQPISHHLEVETYTWDVLPPAYRAPDLATAIARELRWVRERLA